MVFQGHQISQEHQAILVDLDWKASLDQLVLKVTQAWMDYLEERVSKETQHQDSKDLRDALETQDQ